MRGTSAKTIGDQRNDLTVRQELDTRKKALLYTNKILKRIGLFAAGMTEDKNGNIIKPTEKNPVSEMSNNELKAAQIVLDKTLPSLSSVQMVEPDEFDDMSREEMQILLASMVSNNSDLAEAVGLPKIVEAEVIEIKPKKSGD